MFYIIKQLELACVQWSIEFNNVRQSVMTPEQKARFKSTDMAEVNK